MTENIEFYKKILRKQAVPKSSYIFLWADMKFFIVLLLVCVCVKFQNAENRIINIFEEEKVQFNGSSLDMVFVSN